MTEKTSGAVKGGVIEKNGKYYVRAGERFTLGRRVLTVCKDYSNLSGSDYVNVNWTLYRDSSLQNAVDRGHSACTLRSLLDIGRVISQ